jgi:hypothetical protein
MVFCNVSRQEMKLLRHPKLDGLWPICSSRETAIAAVHMTPSEYQVQKAGLTGQDWTTICRGSEAKAREVFHWQLQHYSGGCFRLLDPNGQVIEERKAAPPFSAN